MSDIKNLPGANGASTEFQPRWRLDIDDDATVTYDRTSQTLTKTNTGETCYLGDYRSFEFEEPRVLWVTSGHAPPLGKWYVTGEA